MRRTRQRLFPEFAMIFSMFLSMFLSMVLPMVRPTPSRIAGSTGQPGAEDLPSTDITAGIQWTHDDRIGIINSPPLIWQADGEHNTARFTHRGQTHRVTLSPAIGKPTRLWWDQGGRPRAGEGTQIAWKTLIPKQLLMAEQQAPGDDAFTLRLQLIDGALTGTVSHGEVLRADFTVDGEPHLAWLIDADLDGEIRGDLDRWVAGPSERMEGLRFDNPEVEMRPLDEAWCLGRHGLRFLGHVRNHVRIEAGPALDRSDLRGRHEQRLVDGFLASIDGVSREAMLEKQGDDPTRPTADSPATWTHVDSWDEALAVGSASERPLIVVFTTSACAWCRLLSFITHQDLEVDRLLRRATLVKLDPELATDDSFQRLEITGVPATVLVNRDGSHQIVPGFKPPSVYSEELMAWLD